jgi:hypothetical protein
MRVTTAQLPEAADSDDKVFTTPNAVIMLDGASAFVPVPVSTSTYAACLGRHLRDDITARPSRELPDTLADAIRATTCELVLKPGASPSSTVTILRERPNAVDVLVLGDNLMILPGEVITDDRMDRLSLAPRRQFRERLAAGVGYGQQHRALLRQLQTEQAKWRNQDGGYWIAEAEPDAASHALVHRRPLTAVPWAIVASDGAYNTMSHLGLTDWPTLASLNSDRLSAVLQRCQSWEAAVDPYGQQLPRAKRHDDKSLVAVRLGTRA